MGRRAGRAWSIRRPCVDRTEQTAISSSKPVVGNTQLLCQFCGRPSCGLVTLRLTSSSRSKSSSGLPSATWRCSRLALQIESTESLPLGFGFRNLQCFGNCVAKLFVVSLLVAQPLDIRALHRPEVADHSLGALQHLVQSQRQKIQHCLARTPILLRESQVQDPWSSNIGSPADGCISNSLVAAVPARRTGRLASPRLADHNPMRPGAELGDQMAWRGPLGNVLQVAACRGPVEFPAVRERDRRFQTKGTDMRHAGPGAKQFDRVLALRDVQLAL